MPLISLSYILLTYNQRNTVEAAVKSALAQEVEGMEIVISDDHSVDGTFEAIREAVDGYEGPHRIILNRNPANLGLAGNLDKAHRISTGDVIIVAAGDDLSYPQRSQRIRDAFDTGNPLLVCSYAKVIDLAGNAVQGNFRTALFYNGWDLRKAARSKSLYIGATGAWHRSLYDSYGPIDAEAYEDLVMGFRAALENRVTLVEEELVQYRVGGGLVGSDFYHADVAAFQAGRRKAMVARQAIMRQRIKDARLYGLPENSPTFDTLRREQVKAALGLAYYDGKPGAFGRKLLAHPIIGLQTWHYERRRKRKLMRYLQSQSPASHG